MRKSKVNIDNDKLQEAAEILRAINHKLRMKILEFIDQNEKINLGRKNSPLGGRGPSR